MNQQTQPEKYIFEEECGCDLAVQPHTRVSVGKNGYVIIRGADAVTGGVATLALGPDVNVLLMLLPYLSHLIVEHHGVDLEKLMGDAEETAELMQAPGNGHVH